MIDQAPGSAPEEAVSVLLLPHRSLTRAGLAGFIAAQSVAAGGFAALAAWRGNVFAPLFAVVALAFVTWCMARVWRASGSGQIIVLTPSRLEIAASPGASGARTTVDFHPYWVRVRLQQGYRRGWPSRLLLGSHGREVEIGKFLNETERRILAQRLTDLLRPLQERGGSQES